MSKCNLLKPLESNTGTFYMFSQYAEDITREQTEKDTYKIDPSQFWALNINLDDLVANNEFEDLNIFIGEIFQNYYENACALMRDNPKWTPETARKLLIQTLEKYKMIHTTMINSYPTIDELQYIGDISMHAHETIDGTGYNEIYCMIPDNAHKTTYYFEKKDQSIAETIPYFIDNILGYECSEPLFVNGLSTKALIDRDGYRVNYNSIDVYKKDDEYAPTPDEVNDDHFNINMIIVFYDVVGQDIDQLRYENIPMGIYFTGNTKPVVDADYEKYEFTNGITKYVANDDIYGQGTSYGLRICTRYLTTANLTMFKDTSVDTITDYAAFTQVMSEMSESQKLMAETTNKTTNIFQGLSDHLANFKNNKVNVPYLMDISGTYYWFVNGKNTGVAANFDFDKAVLDKYQTKLGETLKTQSKYIEPAINELLEMVLDIDANLDGSDAVIIAKWNQLNLLRNNNELKVGKKYRLIDYNAMINESVFIDKNKTVPKYKSMHDNFDIILTAIKPNEFSEIATATYHIDETTNRPNPNVNLNNSLIGNWKIWYDFDNDLDRFAWANPKGHGVIYRMIDEFGNDCPYDFKNIIMYMTTPNFQTGNPEYFYTFNRTKNNNIYDMSLNNSANSIHCKNNIINAKITNKVQDLNFIIFNYTDIQETKCMNNIFGYDCYNIKLKDNTFDNTIKNECSDLTFNMNTQNNHFGNQITASIFATDLIGNKFGNVMTKVNCGNYFQYNTLNSNCENITFGNYCRNNYFNNEFTFSTLSDYVQNCVFEPGVKFISIQPDDDIILSENNYIQNLTIKQGLKGTDKINKEILKIYKTNQDFQINVAKDSLNRIKLYCEADLIKPKKIK